MRPIHHILPFLAGVLTFLLWTSCARKEHIGVSEDPRLQHSFHGNYKTCESIILAFGENGRFACQFNSTESVGHFNDIVWGTYWADSKHVYLHVDRINDDNIIYNSLPLEIADSILFSPSGAGLEIYFKEASGIKKNELSPGGSISSFSTAGNKDDIVSITIIFGLAMLLQYAIPIALAGFLVWLIYRLIKRLLSKKRT